MHRVRAARCDPRAHGRDIVPCGSLQKHTASNSTRAVGIQRTSGVQSQIPYCTPTYTNNIHGQRHATPLPCTTHAKHDRSLAGSSGAHSQQEGTPPGCPIVAEEGPDFSYFPTVLAHRHGGKPRFQTKIKGGFSTLEIGGYDYPTGLSNRSTPNACSWDNIWGAHTPHARHPVSHLGGAHGWSTVPAQGAGVPQPAADWRAGGQARRATLCLLPVLWPVIASH